MSKVADWGRWVVAALLAYGALESFRTQTVSKLVQAVRGKETLYPVYMDVFLCIFCLACAWGIVKWRRWAYVTAIVIFALDALALGVTFSLGKFAATYVVWGVIFCAMLIWLFLPSVRAQHRTRNQTA